MTKNLKLHSIKLYEKSQISVDQYRTAFKILWAMKKSY